MSLFTPRALLLLLLLLPLPVLRAQGGSDLPNKAGWHVEPDAVVPLKGPFNLSGAIPVAFQGKVVFPSTQSAFVAVTPTRAKGVYQVYDLRTMKPVGRPIAVASPFSPFTVPALAPDGGHLAARVKRGTGSAIEVWSVANGKSGYQLDAEPEGDIKAKYCDLLGRGRLWVAKHPGEHPKYTVRTTFEVHDIEAKRLVASFTNPLVPDGRWFTFSAGGRYQWMEQTGGWFLFLVWDLTTGRMVGEREFQGQKETWGIASGLAFSPDGKEMAMLWQPKDRGDTFGRLLCWETASGKKLCDHALGNDWPKMAYLGGGGRRCLQWWPGQGWLLFGHLLVDHDSGRVVHRIGKPPAFSGAIEERRFLDAWHVTALEGALEKKLRVVALPRRQIEAVMGSTTRKRGGN
jgi:hypothetical protein